MLSGPIEKHGDFQSRLYKHMVSYSGLFVSTAAVGALAYYIGSQALSYKRELEHKISAIEKQNVDRALDLSELNAKYSDTTQKYINKLKEEYLSGINEMKALHKHIKAQLKIHLRHVQDRLDRYEGKNEGRSMTM